MTQRGPVPEAVANCRELCRQGVAAKEVGNWDAAEALFRSAVDASPTDATSRRHLAEALWRRGVTDQALIQIEAASRLDATDATLAVQSGEMLLATGALDKALERAEQAIRLDPQLALAWSLRGRVFWNNQDSERALADLHRALQYAPDAPDILLDVAAIYREKRQHQRCLTTLHHLLDCCPDGAATQLALHLQGVTLADLGRWPEATESLLAASDMRPANAEILYQLARAQLQMGQPHAARNAAQQALNSDSAHQASRDLLAKIELPNEGPRY